MKITRRIGRRSSAWRSRSLAIVVALCASRCAAQVDLQAGPLTLERSGTQVMLTFTYSVSAAAPERGYSIDFGIDVNNDGQPDATFAGAQGSRTPGMHTITQEVTGGLGSREIQHGQRIMARIDPQNGVAESDESNNAAFSSLRVDLSILSFQIVQTDFQTLARIVYSVDAPSRIPLALLQLRIDRDNDGEFETIVYTISISPQPGVQQIAPDIRTVLSNLSGGGTMQLRLDPDQRVNEQSELNNTAVSPYSLDFSLVSLAWDVRNGGLGPINAILTYRTDAPGVLSPPPLLAMGIDRNNDNTIDSIVMQSVIEPLSGIRSRSFNVQTLLHSFRVQNGDRLIAIVDYDNRFAETTEANNLVAAAAPIEVDLRPIALTLDGHNVANLSWSVLAPGRTADYTIGVYLDTSDGEGGSPDGQLQRTGSPPDLLLMSFAGIPSTGWFSRQLVLPTRPAAGQRVFAMLDSGETVTELSESNVLSTLRTQAVCGDLNCDDVLDNGDVDAFVLALLDPVLYAEIYPECDRRDADLNEDDRVDNGDIDRFVALLQG